MGIAAGTAQHANEVFSGMQSIIQNIDASYHTNYNNKLKQSGDMAKLSADKAKNVFFEKIPPFNEIKMPDSKNFVKFDDSIKDELNQTPVMNEVLRHVVPAEVKKMKTELHTYIQNQIDQQYKQQEKQCLDERSFLGQYQLPNAYHEITATQDIPDSYFVKIEEFQKKGAINNFKNILEGLNGLRGNCAQMLNDSETILN